MKRARPTRLTRRLTLLERGRVLLLVAGLLDDLEVPPDTTTIGIGLDVTRRGRPGYAYRRTPIEIGGHHGG